MSTWLDPTRRSYEDARTVDLYGADTELFGAERHLVRRYVRPGGRILDLGVGAGRTTRSLAPGARRYIGLDYAMPMLAVCRQRFPAHVFVQADGADLCFRTASFDTVIFSFNGIDCLPSLDDRRRCLRECARVLADGGVFIYSVHNSAFLVFAGMLAGVSWPRRIWRVAYAIAQSARNLRHRLPSRAWRDGHGFVFDPMIHGHGLHTYVADPAHVEQELAAAGFRLLDRVGAYHPAWRPDLATPWYYYAARKDASCISP